MVTIGTEYQQVLSAIESYYGSGSDQWVQIAKYGIGAHDAESILSQVPGVDIYKNNAGQITGYAYNNPFATSSAGIAGEINSNIQVPTQANGTTFKASIPANGDYSGAGGTAALSSGAKSTATGATVSSVLSKVTTGIAAVATGCKLGAWIDSAIYNSNPEYWDSTFPTINPQTWDTIAGKNELGKTAINALFGIDKTTGRTQMYIPENAFAYLAYAMAHEGFFDSSSEMTIDNQSPLALQNYSMPIPFGPPSFEAITATGKWVYTSNAQGVVLFGNSENPSAQTRVMFFSNAPFILNVWWYPNAGAPYHYQVDTPARSLTRNGITEYDLTTNYSFDQQYAPFTLYIKADGAYGWDFAYIYNNGSVTTPKDGVTKQDGAIYPNTNTWNDPESARQNIRTQYPDLYDNSIYTDVPQTDGTTTRIIYYPVNVTSTTGSENETPTNTQVTYNNTYVDDSSTEDLLKTVLRYLYQTQTETISDTPTPPDTPNPTDTGEGSTPPVVPPSGSASALWSVYNPTQAQLNSFGAWLWSSNFIDQILKLFNDPMQSIIGVHKIFAAPSISGTNNIVVGYLDSGVSANVVGAQYTTIDCGTVNVREQFGNVFDYEDTNIRLYLPFIGIVALDTSDVMRGSVHVVYHVDVITGACLAEVRITRDGGGGTLYQFAGDAAVRYPISSGSYMGVVSGVLGVVGGIASSIMSGGATLPMAAGAIAGGISGAKTQVQHSGSFAGNAGAMGAKKPYLIIERPQTAVADGYGNYQGKGANHIASVGDMSGYFKMTDVHTASIVGASEAEIASIVQALESGVIA